MADEPRPTNLPITATDVEHQFWTEQLEPSGQPRTSELLEEVPSFSYKDRVVSVSRKDLDALGNYLLQYGESEGLSSIPPRIRNEWTGSGKKWHQDLWDRSENVPPNYPLVPTEKKTGKKVARIPPKVRGGIMRALRNVPGHVGLGLKAYEAATAAWDLLSKPQQDKLIRLVYPPLPKEGGIADLPMGEEESLFQKPSDLIHQAQEPTVEDIRRVLAEHTDLLMGPSLPVTENRMRMFEAARRKHGPESTRWGENWEEAGRELGFETDAELRTLINDIYDVEERGPFVPGMPKDDPRYEFWALEGPAFERTVQNILEKRSERESYIPDEVISLLHTGAKQNREPGEFIGTLIERGLVPETARDAATKHFEDGIWLREHPSDLRNIDEIFKTGDPRKDQKQSIGQVSDQIDSLVGRNRISLRPSELRQLVPIGPSRFKADDESVKFLEDALRSSSAVAPPWLKLRWIPEKSTWKVEGHEGRHRIIAGESVFGDQNLPVDVFLKREEGYQGRPEIEPDQLTSEMQQALDNRRFIPQESTDVIEFTVKTPPKDGKAAGGFVDKPFYDRAV